MSRFLSVIVSSSILALLANVADALVIQAKSMDMRVSYADHGMLKASFSTPLDSATGIAGSVMKVAVKISNHFAIDAIEECYLSFDNRVSPAPHFVAIKMTNPSPTPVLQALDDLTFEGEHTLVEGNRLGEFFVACVTKTSSLPLVTGMDASVTVSVGDVTATALTREASIVHTNAFAETIEATTASYSGSQGGAVVKIVNPYVNANSNLFRMRSTAADHATTGSTVTFSPTGQSSDCTVTWVTSTGTFTDKGRVSIANAYVNFRLEKNLNFYNVEAVSELDEITPVTVTIKCPNMATEVTPFGIPSTMEYLLNTNVQYGISYNSAWNANLILVASTVLLSTVLYLF